jgi:dTDP-4-amino-4,6-dideoxygalactose transaminase
MDSKIRACEERLANMHGRRHCVLTGSGTAALWMAYAAVQEEKPKVLLPSTICLDPVLAVSYAKKVPVFADVRGTDATIDPVAVADAIANDPEIGVVVGVHLFGHSADVEELSQICEARGVLFVEDAAQALGGTLESGKPFGSGGDVAVLSFGHSKILDVGSGGAVLTDDEERCAVIRRHGDTLPCPSPNRSEYSACYRDLYYAIWKCGERDRAFFEFFDLFPDRFKPLHLHRPSEETAAAILDCLSDLPDVVRHRRQCAKLYREVLDGLTGTRFFRNREGDVPWRFSFCVAERRDRVLESVRAAGFDASRWYPNVSDWTPSGRAQGRERFSVANRIEREIVNLWVAPSYDEDRVLQTAQAVVRALD